MFGFKRKKREIIYDYDLVGCIGKLPLHAEFIKHHVEIADIAQLDQWYQVAYHQLSRHYGQDLKKIFQSMPAHHFIYMNYKLPMIGTLISSSDQSGRVYPFVLFRILENPLAQELKFIISSMYQE